MKWNTKFNYPRSSRSNEDGMRKYLSGNEKYPSVTSILSLTKSEEDKASLELWKQRVGYKEANRIKTDASRRGTSLVNVWLVRVPFTIWELSRKCYSCLKLCLRFIYWLVINRSHDIR